VVMWLEPNKAVSLATLPGRRFPPTHKARIPNTKI
jgi:hypothetical protein